MNLYFGNFTTIVSTLLVLAVLVYIALTIVNHKKLEHWGRRNAILAAVGLLVCCFVAVRDGYHLSVQASIDNTITAGLFTLSSIPSTLCCIGGAVIAVSSFSSIFIKNQKYRKVIFFILSFTFVFKVLIIEISRLVVL